MWSPLLRHGNTPSLSRDAFRGLIPLPYLLKVRDLWMMRSPVSHSPLTLAQLTSQYRSGKYRKSATVIKALIQKREKWEAQHTERSTGIHQIPALVVEKVSWLAHLAAPWF